MFSGSTPRSSSILKTAAFIIGTSIVMSLGEGPSLLGVPLFEILGLGAVCGGLWVLYSIGKEDMAVTRVPLAILES